MKRLTKIRNGKTGETRAFTLVELLVVLVVIAAFGAVTLPAMIRSREPVLRAQCANNLRQMGAGWSMYQQEFDQVMPCHWPGYTDSYSASNPWRTYEVYRVVPGTGVISSTEFPPSPDGPWNLGTLVACHLVASPRVLYCPSTSRVSPFFSYDYYATPPNSWPSTPPGSLDNIVRAGYNYYPQLRALESIGGGRLGPKPARTPTRWTELDPKKSIATDLVSSYDFLSHRATGSVIGLNALFPDGRVVFQSVRDHPGAFDPNLWNPSGSPTIGNYAPNFRYVMSLWKP
jgi:prepilin-type N-terminal cleavage/methylation domain-containing protein